MEQNTAIRMLCALIKVQEILHGSLHICTKNHGQLQFSTTNSRKLQAQTVCSLINMSEFKNRAFGEKVTLTYFTLAYLDRLVSFVEPHR